MDIVQLMKTKEYFVNLFGKKSIPSLSKCGITRKLMMLVTHEHDWIKLDSERYQCSKCLRRVSSNAFLAWLIGQSPRLITDTVDKIIVER